ncbi:tetratricopeptide (TPR) repeat protein [Filimonas zeae]|uniref:Tetratricopeptide repeat protein n=1 Tax=Filimonas zeae TaxID=1737353 RepID=A0A917MZW7_9BACT|nr:hypothetical protein [Filimonas zeae]MDR6341038.1 tetratricopeptide (TPR) repeat protein [Filimonas zeae]GGH77474.1 hypothetical protein GCM10011379_43880 [Filimonas zeae]
MKKTAILLLGCALSLMALSQDNDFKRDLDKAKEEMKRNGPDESPDYNRAGRLLESALQKNANSAEAWYFYGYAIDKLNAVEGEYMVRVQPGLTRKASEAFEKAVALSNDVYTGELMLLDPHTKILTVWGSQAMKYAYDNKPDSTLWSLQQAATRGGIDRTVLAYFRQVMDECTKGAFLFTNGDLYLYYLLYLQQVEKYRTDVVCVDINLLNTRWYPRWMVKKGVLPVSYAPADLEKLDIMRWEAKTVSMRNNNSRLADTGIAWKLWPSFSKKYLLRSDRILLDVLQQNAFKQEVYFPADVPSTMMLFLDKFLVCHGLTNKLVMDTTQNTMPLLMARLKKLRYLPSTSRGYLNNRDNIQVLNNYRFTYTTAVNLALQQQKPALALQLMESVEHKYPETTLPFFAPGAKDWFAQLRKKTEEKAKME